LKTEWLTSQSRVVRKHKAHTNVLYMEVVYEPLLLRDFTHYETKLEWVNHKYEDTAWSSERGYETNVYESKRHPQVHENRW
jgi:hypothetical protein